METVFFGASIAGLVLTVNAWRPFRNVYLTVPVFFGGWLMSELAPVLLVIHVVTVAAFVLGGAVQGVQGWVALALSSASGVVLWWMVREADRVHDILEDALGDGLGEDYRERLTPTFPYEQGRRWFLLLMPFWLWSRAVRRHRGIRYGDRRFRNALDVYTPRAGAHGAPVLLYVHGGGWSPVSNKNHQGKPLMHHLAARGWVCVSANYRVSPKVAFPEHLIDVKRALAWVKANVASHGGDPSFVVVTGGSAGGHLAALVGLTQNDPEYQPGFEQADTSVQGCVPHYGVYDFTPDAGTKFVIKRGWFLEKVIMQRSLAEHRAEFEKASPHYRVHEDAPPFFVVHGANDSLAPVTEARAFVAKLREVSGAPVVYAELTRTQHAFDVFHSIRTTHVVRAVERFCDYLYATTHAAGAVEPQEPEGAPTASG